MAKEQEYLWVKSPFTEHVWSLSQQAAVRPQTTNRKTAKKLEKKKEKKKPLVTTVAFQQALYIAKASHDIPKSRACCLAQAIPNFFFFTLKYSHSLPCRKDSFVDVTKNLPSHMRPLGKVVV